ncbi:hypothetical protein TrCOL_g6170 [Triparma columacea]|uniref:Uncharacterized protein n=1 Tax=Triparma columacea TaxID=722753 RepID=A0A9W7G6R9_9STRA|nr:hypothetical protein TrCOL_g6170 [Triparma columacea]
MATTPSKKPAKGDRKGGFSNNDKKRTAEFDDFVEDPEKRAKREKNNKEKREKKAKRRREEEEMMKEKDKQGRSEEDMDTDSSVMPIQHFPAVSSAAFPSPPNSLLSAASKAKQYAFPTTTVVSPSASSPEPAALDYDSSASSSTVDYRELEEKASQPPQEPVGCPSSDSEGQKPTPNLPRGTAQFSWLEIHEKFASSLSEKPPKPEDEEGGNGEERGKALIAEMRSYAKFVTDNPDQAASLSPSEVRDRLSLTPLEGNNYSLSPLKGSCLTALNKLKSAEAYGSLSQAWEAGWRWFPQPQAPKRQYAHKFYPPLSEDITVGTCLGPLKVKKFLFEGFKPKKARVPQAENATQQTGNGGGDYGLPQPPTYQLEPLFVGGTSIECAGMSGSVREFDAATKLYTILFADGSSAQLPEEEVRDMVCPDTEEEEEEEEEEGKKLFSIFTSKKVSSSTTMSTSSSALPSNVASSSPALSIPRAGVANGAMQPCWCSNKGCDGTAKRWPCTAKGCCGGRKHPCKEMKWTKKSGKVQAYKSCKTKRAQSAVTNPVINARWNPINNPIYRPIYQPLRDAAKRAEATARKKEEEAIRLSNDVPNHTENELKSIVRNSLKASLLAAALKKATFVYVFTASRDRRDKEAMTVFKSGKSRTPPLQSRSSPSSPLRDLLPAEIDDLKLRIYDIFGFDQHASEAINEANMEGFRHTAVARVEALVHIHLWKHPARAWQKVGGDHAKGRSSLDGVVDTSRRVVRIILSTERLPPNFVWTVDHTKECAQKWSSGA